MHTFVKIHCYAPFLLSVAAYQESAVFRGLARFSRIIAKQRLIGAFQWISAQSSPNMHHSIIRSRIKAVPGLHASFIIFLVNL